MNILASTSFYNYISFHLCCSSQIQCDNILTVFVTFKRHQYLYLKTAINRNRSDTLNYFLYFTCRPFNPHVVIQGDSLARGPKLLSIRNYVNQLTDDELTTGYYQQDGATCHTSNASM